MALPKSGGLPNPGGRACEPGALIEYDPKTQHVCDVCREVLPIDRMHVHVQPQTLSCNACGETFGRFDPHSCVPGLVKRIAALEAVVAELKSIIGFSNVTITTGTPMAPPRAGTPIREMP